MLDLSCEKQFYARMYMYILESRNSSRNSSMQRVKMTLNGRLYKNNNCLKLKDTY